MFSERVQSTRGRRREQTRDRVVACAQELFATQGFAATTIRQIATAAQVSVGTVMGVGDKDSLLLASFDDWIGDMHAERDAIEACDDPVRRAGEVVAPFLALFDADRALAHDYAAVLVRAGGSSAVFGALAQMLQADFTAVFADAGLGDDATAAGRTVYLVYLGLVMTAPATGADVASIRADVEACAALLLRSHRKES